MHPYAIDSNERGKVVAAIAFLSVAAAWLLNTHVSFPWWVDAPSVWGFFGLFYALFDRRFWKLKLLRRMGIVSVPDLSGVWQGGGTSSYDGHQTTREFGFELRQTWTKMSVVVKYGSSRSHSMVGAILDVEGGNPTLVYEYLNEPDPDALGTMHIHRGLTRLTFLRENGKDVFEGHYYTGRDRQTVGHLRFERRIATPVVEP